MDYHRRPFPSGWKTKKRSLIYDEREQFKTPTFEGRVVCKLRSSNFQVASDCYIRDVSNSVLIFKTKTVEFAKKIKVKDFHVSEGWLDR